ncbi:1177_t:CDS:2, partial [Ambispora gerdemannii]
APDTLLDNQATIFRYLQIKQKLSPATNLPFLDLPPTNLVPNIKTSNEKEQASLEVFSQAPAYNNQEITLTVYAVVSHCEKKDNNNYVLLLQDIR